MPYYRSVLLVYPLILSFVLHTNHNLRTEVWLLFLQFQFPEEDGIAVTGRCQDPHPSGGPEPGRWYGDMVVVKRHPDYVTRNADVHPEPLPTERRTVGTGSSHRMMPRRYTGFHVAGSVAEGRLV